MSIFQFKQFSVDQADCAMNINTDGVLLGALTTYPDPKRILDIGTGTGVIALMLAQRFPGAQVDAVEIDGASADRALKNFNASPFSHRMSAHAMSFQEYFTGKPALYDLIVSNPPFFLDSLQNPDARKTVARHADAVFFNQLIMQAAGQLSQQGNLNIIVPTGISGQLSNIAGSAGLYLHKTIEVKSFSHSAPHRNILVFGFAKQMHVLESFVIYESEKNYSAHYRSALAGFFTIF